jgi:hypothetical protein
MESIDQTNATARAFVVYSLVPYLGLLFCPGALVVGSWGLIRGYRTLDSKHRSAYFLIIAAAVLVATVQLLLWWLLYKVPAWAIQGF